MINRFTNPFRYTPHPLVRSAAELVMSDLDQRIKENKLPEEVCKGFKEGKMLGVLIVSTGGDDSEPRYLAAFSGSVGNHSAIKGFVPPIYDLLNPEGYFKEKEAEISALNREISNIMSSDRYTSLNAEVTEAMSQRDIQIKAMMAKMALSKQERDRRRSEGCDPSILIKESQFEKAELRRLKLSWEEKIKQINIPIAELISRVSELKKQRAKMSDVLQEWIFRQYRVHNALGEESSIYDIFAGSGFIPPGGTGDCAAPKLLEYAYRNNLKPLAIGEFWYGTSPDTAVRTQGHFYPSCTSKCGPLLGYMLQGLELESDTSDDDHSPAVLSKDDTIIAISKPSGMPSVPGLDGKVSAQEWLEKEFGAGSIHPIHRLDMDTSGVLLFARTAEAAVNMRRQFEEHTISKTYVARLTPQDKWSPCLHKAGEKGIIELPLSADYDERPRQKVDRKQGKEAITRYEIVSINPDGTIDIRFYPVTGRTHQLRVHSAHNLGLRTPILGDMLYGGQYPMESRTPERLHLHALSITFRHPDTGCQTTIESPVNIY